MTEKIAFEVVNSTPKIKKKSSILCDNNKVKICIFMIQNLVMKTIRLLIIISMKYYCDIYQLSVVTLLIYRESKKMAITFKFLSLDFFLMLEVGLTTSNTIFSLIF